MTQRVRRIRRHQRHREAVMRAHNGVCHICGQPAADAIDHIVAVAWGGSDDPANLAPAHTSCNSAKGDSPPPSWTYSRPEMWIAGYGPKGAGGVSASRVGCWTYGWGMVIGFIIGAAVSALVGLSAFLGGITVAVAVFVTIVVIRSTGQQKQRAVPSVGEPTEITIDGEQNAPRNARGIIMNGGRALDTVSEGDSLIQLEFIPTGDNIETLVDLLKLSPGGVGYRDGLVRAKGPDLEVLAMIRLASDVEASGDEEVGAAPIGIVPAGDWARYPTLGEGITLVQIAVSVNLAGNRGGWIVFSQLATERD